MRSKLLVFFFGCLFTFAFAEISLRAWSAFSTAGVPVKSVSENGEAKRKAQLLFIGNSYTAGVLVEPEEKFTEQLKRLLGDGWEVLNLARPSMNTRETLTLIHEKKARPDIVFIMAGQPNAWNNFGYTNYLNEAGIRNPVNRFALFLSSHLYTARFFQYVYFQLFPETPAAVVPEMLESGTGEFNEKNFYIGVSRLIDDTKALIPLDRKLQIRKLIATKLSENPEQKNLRMARLDLNWRDHLNENEIAEDLDALTAGGTRFNYFAYQYLTERLKAGPKKKPWDPIRQFLVTSVARDRGLQWQVQIIGSDWSTLLGYLTGSDTEKAQLVRKMYEERLADMGYRIGFFTAGIDALVKAKEIKIACQVLRYGISVHPVRFTGENFWFRAARLSDRCKKAEGDLLERDLVKLKEKEFVTDSDLVFISDEDSMKDIHRWRVYDLSKIVDFFRSQGAQVVIETYLPSRDTNRPRSDNEALYQVAAVSNVLLLDHFRHFLQKYPTLQERDFIYVQGLFKGTEDDHYSPEGHRLVAEDIYRFMQEKNLLTK